MSDSVNLRMKQGADWAVQLYWTDQESDPIKVVAPMRMDIVDEVGGIAQTLQTTDNSDELEDSDGQTILYNSESGLIQLMLSAEQTAKLSAGIGYSYDLFVNYMDDVVGTVRTACILSGTVTVTRRVTKNV